jgi:lysine 6-dehydrogenase
MQYLVLGAGKQGSACALDLLEQSSTTSVILADRDVGRVPAFLKGQPKLTLQAEDFADSARMASLMRGVSSVLSAAPYYLNVELARLAVEAGAHFADLGGNTEIVFQQKALHDHAVRRGVSVIPDCGLAPGMINILAGEGIARLDEVESVKIYVGGLPQHPEPPLNYMVVYSLEGALDYYTTPSWVLRGGKRVQVEPLSEVETIQFPELGALEAFHTAGGISTMPFDYEGKIPMMEYKTLRYPGHVAIMRPIRELGLLSTTPVEVNGHRIAPRDAFIASVSPRLTKPDGHDLVALRVDVTGTKGSRRAGTRWQLLDRFDEQRGVSAMMRTTGYSLSITGMMQVDGRIAKKGVCVPDEAVPCRPYVAELARRGIVIEETQL